MLKTQQVKKYPTRILTKDTKRHFAKEDIQMGNKHWKDIEHHEGNAKNISLHTYQTLNAEERSHSAYIAARWKLWPHKPVHQCL